MNQINSRYKIPGMQRVEVDDDEIFDFSAAQHVAKFLHGEIVKEKRETVPHIQNESPKDQDSHVCTGMCENCSCNEG